MITQTIYNKMFSYTFRQCLRQYFTVRTVEKCVNKINAREFESNLINTSRTFCTTTKIEDKSDKNYQRTSSELQNQIVSKIESVFKCNNKEATEIFNA